METPKTRNSLRSLTAGILAGLAGLVSIVSAEAQTSSTNLTTQTPASQIKTSGNMAYFAGTESKIGAPTSYPEINHATTLPYQTRVSGFLDFYGDDKGYFGKTVIEKGLTENLNFRSHVEHINNPLSRVGAGLSYALPGMPKKTFAKLSYLPYFVDNKGEQVDNRQIVAFVAGANLPYNLSLLTFGEINVDGANGSQWCYGELELAKSFGRFSIGANLQLNGKGTGKMTPEIIPRIALRAKF
jgi:hypothetical protein